METLELITSNASGKAQRRTLFGRDFLVAKSVLINPGVLNGSQGPLYYPPEEVSRNPELWNFKPLTLNHPPNGANDPEILNATQLGFLLNSRVEDGRLVADAWFDLMRVIQVDNRILTKLTKGEPIELSTGLGVQQEPVENGRHNGKAYIAIARDFKPDHLAVLMDTKGACSLQDGCGILVNELVESIKNLSPDERRELITVLSQDMGDKKMANEKLIADLIANCDCWTEKHKDILANMSDAEVQSFLDKAKSAKQAEAVANAAKKGYEDKNGKLTFNAEKGEWEFSEKFELTNEPPEKGKGKTPVTNSEPTKESILNAMKGLSAEEWFEMAPPEVQETTREATEIRNSERAKLIEQIVDNVDDSQKEHTKRIAENSTTDHLKAWVSTLPKKVTNNPFAPSYAGMAPAVTNESFAKPEPIPDVDWSFSS